MPEAAAAAMIEQRRRGLHRAVLACAWGVVAFSLLNLGAWWAVAEHWMTFGLVVPAPRSTAVLLALLGVALALRQMWPGRRRVEVGVLAVAGVVLLAALSVVWGYVRGPAPRWEAWLGDLSVSVAGLPVGRMLPTGAILFIASLFPFVLFSLALERYVRLRRAAAVIAALIACLCFLNLVSYTAGDPPFTGSQFIALTVPVSLNFALLNTGLLFSIASSFWLRKRVFGVEEEAALPALMRDQRRLRRLLGLWSAVILAIIVVYIRLQTAFLRDRVTGELQSMDDLKASDVLSWRTERLSDARVLAHLPALVPAMRAVAAGPDRTQNLDDLQRWLREVEESYHYKRVIALNAALEPLAPPWQVAALTDPALREQLRRPLGRADVIELDPYVDRAGELRWDVLAVIRPAPGAPPVGAILLQTDIASALWPVLRAWPGDNKTGQFVLWHRSGNRLFSMGGLRGGSGQAGAAERPFGQVRDLTQANLLLARVARGERGLIDGLDVRGIPIVGLGKWIPGSDWLLSCRVDASEVYAPVRRSAWQVVAVSAAIFGMIGVAVMRSWRERQLTLLHDKMTAELEQGRAAARLGAILRTAHDSMIVLDGDLRIVEANPHTVETYGWSLEELRQMHAWDLRSAASRSQFKRDEAKVRNPAGSTLETEHQRKDGTVFPVEASAIPVEIDGRPHYFSIIRDITERRTQERRITQLAQMYQVLSQINGVIIHTPEKAKLLDTVCALLADLGQFRLAAIYWHDPATKTLRPIAQAGVASDYTRGVVVRSDDRPEGRGSTGTAFREDRTVVHTDFRNDPTAEPWRAQADAAGIRASIAIPIRQHRLPVAVLAVYDQQENRFAPEEAMLLEKAADNLSFALEVIDQARLRQAAEAELRQAEELYRGIFDGALEGIFRTSVEGKILRANPAMARILGYEAVAELMAAITDSAIQIWHDAGEREQWKRLLAEQGAVHGFECRIKRRDGTATWVSVSTRRVGGPDGQTLYYEGFVDDITDRKKARETLLQFNAELEQRVATRTSELAARTQEIQVLLDSIPDTVLLCDRSGAILFCHLPPPAERPPFATQAFDETSLLCREPAVLDALRQLQAAVEANRGVAVREFELSWNKATATIEGHATAIGDDRTMILLRDISERKRVERVVLANLDRERQLSEMKSRFVSVASHEFRTPLSAAMGTLELMERHAAKLTDAKRADMLRRAQQSLTRLSIIVGDVLKLSRADSGRLAVNRMAIDLPGFVQDVINEVQAGDGKQHRFVFSRAGGPETVPVDTNLVHHILSNLISNAVRYSSVGSEVAVTLAVGEADFTLEVADQGIGIPVAERARIFEPFVRGSNVGTIGGTGLGLNIVKRYVELMGGGIELLDVARGTTFRVTVPLTQPAA